MRQFHRLALFGILIAALPAAAEHPSVPAVRELIGAILSDSGFQEKECPGRWNGDLFGRSQVCATIDMDTAKFTAVWDGFMRDAGRRFVVEEQTAWERDPRRGKKVAVKRWSIEGSPVVVFFNETKKLFAVRYSDYRWNRWPCGELHARTGIYRHGDEGLIVGELIAGAGPEYPESARVVRAEGTVVVHAIVSPEGDVVDTCVAQPHARNLGFEEAAIEAVRQYTYEPSLLDGKPVSVWVVAWTEFNLH